MALPRTRRLAVHLHGELVGILDKQDADRFRLTYTPEAVERHYDGIVLSVSLPVREQRYPSAQARPFFEGLLPEGPARATIAQRFGVSVSNGFGLLERLGADCAGAATITAEDAEPRAEPREVEWLDEGALARRIDELPSNPLGVDGPDGRVRLSLAGVQQKLVVARAPDGRIGEPLDGAPSTHILKPGDERFPGLVENEAFCLRVAREAGLPVAAAEVIHVAGVSRLLIERFDRMYVDGRVERIHQEDACQALGILPSAKYEAEGGPSLADVVRLLRNHSGANVARDLNDFLALTVLNVVLGNADAHGKNVALLHPVDGSPHLAPAYDLVATNVYAGLNRELAMPVGGIANPDAVDADAWRALARTADLGSQILRLVREHTERVIDAARQAQQAARDEGWFHPVIDQIVELAKRRAVGVA